MTVPRRASRAQRRPSSAPFPVLSPWRDAPNDAGANHEELSTWESEGGALPLLSVYWCVEPGLPTYAFPQQTPRDVESVRDLGARSGRGPGQP